MQGYEASGNYLMSVWNSALRRVPKNASIKKILILDFGGGGNVNPLHRRFPKARVTAVEWDPVMVEIADQCRCYSSALRPRIIIDDATHALGEMTEKFDLIIFDAYIGNTMMSIRDSAFVTHLARVLEPDGYLLFNASDKPAALDLIKPLFSEHERWKYRFNHLGLFRHFGMGKAGDPLPEGYHSFHAVHEYLRRESLVDKKRQLMGEHGAYGLRWRHGPWWFEGYRADHEPKIQPFDHWRMVIWQPITRLDKPQGWYRSWIQMNARKTCFAEIAHPEKYWEAWSSHAQRHRRRWLKQEEFVGGDATLEEFVAAYRQCDKLRLLKEDFIKFLQRKAAAHGTRMRYLVARHHTTNEIRAGLAVLDIPEARQSVHIISFIQPDAEKRSVGFGLIDLWFKHGIDHHLRFLDFDLFWALGDPKGWKGYSNFKRQFGVRYICYPNPLIRFIPPHHG